MPTPSNLKYYIKLDCVGCVWDDGTLYRQVFDFDSVTSWWDGMNQKDMLNRGWVPTFQVTRAEFFEWLCERLLTNGLRVV